MSEKIYYGDVDIIDTRTKTVRRLKEAVYKTSNTLVDIMDKEIRKIPHQERKYYKIIFHPETAIVLGVSNI